MNKKSSDRKKLFEEFFDFIDQNNEKVISGKDDTKQNFTKLGRLFAETKGKGFKFGEVDSRRGRYAKDIKENYPTFYEKLSIGECEFLYRFKSVNGEETFERVREQYEDYLRHHSNSLSYLKGLLSEHEKVEIDDATLDTLIEEMKHLTNGLKALKSSKNKDKKDINILRRRLAKLCNSPLNVNAEYLRYYNDLPKGE